jgi:hypothetical protein
MLKRTYAQVAAAAAVTLSAAAAAERNKVKDLYAQQISKLYKEYIENPIEEKLLELFNTLSDLLWVRAEYTCDDTGDNLWNEVLVQNSCQGRTIKDCLLDLFEIESKWLKYDIMDVTTWKPMIDPSILFFKFLLHVIRYLSEKAKIINELIRKKLRGVSIIVGESDNHGILNIALSKEHTLFYKKRTKENVDKIDEIIDAINLEFDSRKFHFTYGNYSLNHVVSFFCNQLLVRPVAPKQTVAYAKNRYEDQERKKGTIQVLEDKEIEHKLEMMRKDHDIEVKKELRELKAKADTDRIVKDAKKSIQSMVRKIRKPKPPCKYGLKCRILSRTPYGISHFKKYQHPLYKGEEFKPINERTIPSNSNGGSRLKTRKRNTSIKYTHTKNNYSRSKRNRRTRRRH